MKTTLLDQIRKRRLALGVKIQDMPLLAGLTRQQYGKIEARGWISPYKTGHQLPVKLMLPPSA